MNQSDHTPFARGTVLVTGATGYIGGRLVPALLDAGHEVRCLVRTPSKLRDIDWVDRVTVVQGSLEDDGAVREAMAGCTAAYFLAAGKALGRLPMSLRVRVDDRRLKHHKAMMVLIGNVGGIPPNIDLIPGAASDDGLLDVMLASPRRFRDWFKIIGRMLVRRQRRDDALELRRGRKVEVTLKKPESYQLDGDVEGEFTHLVAEIDPGALTVVVPSTGAAAG